MIVLHRRRRLLVLACLFVLVSLISLSLLFSPYAASSQQLKHKVIISLASTASRLHTELPRTLRSLLRQRSSSHEIYIHLHLPDHERSLFSSQNNVNLPNELSNARIKVLFVPDKGPATK